MKLSKLTLQWLVHHALHSDVAGYTEFKIVKEIEEALENGTFEIEGYQRDKWIKLNRNNKKTFPPKGEFLGCFITGYRAICIREDEESDEEFASEERYPGLAYWRPLPKPPIETEAEK